MHRASQRTTPSLRPRGYREPPPSPDANPRHYGYETFEEYVADLDPLERKRLLRDMAKYDAMRASWGQTSRLYQDRFPSLFQEDGQPKEDPVPPMERGASAPHPGPRSFRSDAHDQPRPQRGQTPSGQGSSEATPLVLDNNDPAPQRDATNPLQNVYYANGKIRKPYDYIPHPEPKGDPSPGLPAGYIAYKTGTYYDAEVNPIPPRRPQGPIDSFTQNLLRETLPEFNGGQNAKHARS